MHMPQLGLETPIALLELRRQASRRQFRDGKVGHDTREKISRWRFSFGAGATSPEAVQAMVGSLIEKGVPMIFGYVPKAVLAVHEQPVEWFAVLELTAFNAIIVKHGGGRRSDAEHPVL